MLSEWIVRCPVDLCSPNANAMRKSDIQETYKQSWIISGLIRCIFTASSCMRLILAASLPPPPPSQQNWPIKLIGRLPALLDCTYRLIIYYCTSPNIPSLHHSRLPSDPSIYGSVHAHNFSIVYTDCASWRQPSRAPSKQSQSRNRIWSFTPTLPRKRAKRPMVCWKRRTWRPGS